MSWKLVEPAPPGRRCQVSGPAAALYLLLWNRGSLADSIDVSGDADVLTTWRDRLRVRWS